MDYKTKKVIWNTLSELPFLEIVCPFLLRSSFFIVLKGEDVAEIVSFSFEERKKGDIVIDGPFDFEPNDSGLLKKEVQQKLVIDIFRAIGLKRSGKVLKAVGKGIGK